MQPRIQTHLAYLDELIQRLETHIQKTLLAPVDISDVSAMSQILEASKDKDLTMADIASQLQQTHRSEPINQSLAQGYDPTVGQIEEPALEIYQWYYREGTLQYGDVQFYGLYFCVGQHLAPQSLPISVDEPLVPRFSSVAMGIFEGHMAKMAEGFKAIRKAELVLNGQYNRAEHEEFFTYFNWHQFTDHEWLLCPPVVALGGDGAMYDIGFQNLSRMMASGKPIKVIVVDTQVYSNTGGQACTSGFIGQISDMAQYGKVWKGKPEPRKEIGLIAMAHRNTYVMQGSLANTSHMLEGFIDGLITRRPALFNLYTTCQPEHGVGDDLGTHQAKLALESRAYPLFKYNPDAGKTAAEAFDLSGNPGLHQLWPTYTLKYLESGREKRMELPMTFADFAITEARFRKHFRKVPRDAWNENMMPLAEFLEMDTHSREGKFPYIWAVDRNQQLSRVMVDSTIVESCEERRDFWIMLRDIAGVKPEAPKEENLEEKIRAEVVGKIAQGLMQLAGGGGDAIAQMVVDVPTPTAAAPMPIAANGEGYMAPWLDTSECSSCDECVKLNGSIFAYNEDKKAYIKDPNGGPYTDLVKAAEKCTARVIHPGLPADRSAKDIEKWIQRGEKFN
ncbi:MAG: thiamine pyrophosphate-dependent enzyme [Saprospiraceae bacterium]